MLTIASRDIRSVFSLSSFDKNKDNREEIIECHTMAAEKRRPLSERTHFVVRISMWKKN